MLSRTGLGAKNIYSNKQYVLLTNRTRAVAQVGLPEKALGRKGEKCGEGVSGRTCYSIAT